MKRLFLFLSFFIILQAVYAKSKILSLQYSDKIILGAQQFDSYLPLITGKRVAIVTNQTGVIGNEFVLDILYKKGINITKIFSPEHGFRGTAEAGAAVSSDIDPSTGIPIISLYGSHKKPTAGDLKDIDVVLFDIQDVGVRFYTYISTLHYVMEACAEDSNHIPVIVLDRPNPNGFYIDGPVREDTFSSFIGMHKVPIVYGMTIGEYAQMLKGEKWIKSAENADLTIIPLLAYTHNSLYRLPVNPSPNLTSMSAVYLYPSLCLFEGTNVSIGRGTDKPFQVYGFPENPVKKYTFTPLPIKGKSENPIYNGKLCYGEDLTNIGETFALEEQKISLQWLIRAYNNFPDKEHFFIPFMYKLIGNTLFNDQIKQGLSEEEIRATWQKDIDKFKEIRKKYLLYE